MLIESLELRMKVLIRDKLKANLTTEWKRAQVP